MSTTERTFRERVIRVPLDVTINPPRYRGGDWIIEAGRWRIEKPTQKAALDAFVTGLRTFLVEYEPPSVLTFAGHVAIVSPDLSGWVRPLVWRQDIVKPDGRQLPSIISVADRQEAEAHARQALAFHATDWFDDTSVQDGADYLVGGERYGYGEYGPQQLYDYAAFQRAAKAAMDAGHEDWHDWASRHAAEYAVPRRTPAAAQPASVPERAWNT